MEQTQRPIVVVGSINTDLVVTAGRLPLPGETVRGTSFATFQGGKGANQAVAVARLGYPVKMIGKVGSDAFGTLSLTALRGEGVEVEAIEFEPGASGVALITVGDAGENSIVVVPGANGAVTPELVERARASIRGAAMVLTQLEVPVETVLRLAEICREEGVPLMLDPAPAMVLPEHLPAMCAWITPNESEARFLVGEGVEGDEQVAAALLGLGVERVVLKLGERGAYLATADGFRARVEPFPVKAVDRTAAGDTFNGAFAVGLAQGKDAVESARLASAAAALSVARAGAQASMPTAGEVADFLSRHQGRTSSF